MASEKVWEYRLFGLSEEEVCRRLEQLPTQECCVESLQCVGEETVLQLTVSETAAANTAVALEEIFGIYIYSRQGKTLPQQVVTLLQEHGLSLATAESCTGGMVAQQLTAVPGCSQVFGTGVVSYSCACKQQLLNVKEETLAAHGAVSGETAGEMARGVCAVSGASLGVAVTGEAGPVAAEDRPVGTVFVALADAKRTWVKELQPGDKPGSREEIRLSAAAHALDLVRRYLEAYPAVMAGGQPHHREAARSKSSTLTGRAVTPRAQRTRPAHRRVLWKMVAFLAAVCVLLAGIGVGYRYLIAPDNNRQLQSGLGALYWNQVEDLTQNGTDAAGIYPQGMMVQFRSLYERNADVRGWIRIPDTAVDYPVMAYRNKYYESHNFTDQYSVYGQPYFGKDTFITPQMSDRTITIYGNNTEDGQMFSDLLSYRRIAYLREHPVIEMNTLFEMGRFEIFAVVVADERNKEELDYARSDFADAAEFEEYLKALQQRSLFHADSVVNGEESILLLSTQAQSVYGFSDAQLVVAARRISGESTVRYRVNKQVRWPSAMTDRRTTTTTVGTIKPSSEETKTTAADVVQTSTTSVVSTASSTTAGTTVSTSATWAEDDAEQDEDAMGGVQTSKATQATDADSTHNEESDETSTTAAQKTAQEDTLQTEQSSTRKTEPMLRSATQRGQE